MPQIQFRLQFYSQLCLVDLEWDSLKGKKTVFKCQVTMLEPPTCF